MRNRSENINKDYLNFTNKNLNFNREEEKIEKEDYTKTKRFEGKNK